MDDDIAIKAEHLQKVFKLPHEKHTSIKSALINFRHRKKGYERQHVLKGISFEVKKGEFFGIVGRNGSGKSTLLKTLAGIYTPNGGSVRVSGKLTPFIELGVGFNYELTGRENVFLNGALLGFSHQEMENMYDDIVRFAELERFMDQKLKNYSSGMQVRLAFSISSRVQSDILLIDEVLAVGDAAFQQKCFEMFAELRKKDTTIILVTHDMNSVLRFCDRAIMIKDGEIVEEGRPAVVADAYLKLNYEGQEEARAKEPKKDKEEVDPDKPLLLSAVVRNSKGNAVKQFDPGEECTIEVKYQNPTDKRIHLGIQIYSETDVLCFSTNSKVDGLDATDGANGKASMKISLDLVPGNYYVTVGTLNENATVLFNYKTRFAEFRITKKSQQGGVALLQHQWVKLDV